MLACGTPPPLASEERVNTYIGQADQLGAMGKWLDAIEMMNKADSIKPGDMSILHLRGTLKGRLGDYSGAVEDLNRSIGLCTVEKQCRILHLARAKVHEGAGHLDLACEDWKLAGGLADFEIKQYCK